MPRRGGKNYGGGNWNNGGNATKPISTLIAEHSGMSFLSTGSGASAAPSAPSNPNARYNCSLSHAELVLLVEKSKEAEADKKKKDMLELISAAQKCGGHSPRGCCPFYCCCC